MSKAENSNDINTNKKPDDSNEEPKKYKSSNIPPALFLEDLDKFLANSGQKAEVVMKLLDEQHCKYKFMESNLSTKKQRTKAQIPDLERSLAAVDMLKNRLKNDDKREIICDFLLSDEVYRQAKIHSTDTVFLWLGANVMLEYTLDDAADLLTKNLESAKKNIDFIDQELTFLREQRIITEVNMARVYNWDVNKQVNVESITDGVRKL